MRLSNRRRRRKRKKLRTRGCSSVAECVLSRQDPGFHLRTGEVKRKAEKETGGRGSEVPQCRVQEHWEEKVPGFPPLATWGGGAGREPRSPSGLEPRLWRQRPPWAATVSKINSSEGKCVNHY